MLPAGRLPEVVPRVAAPQRRRAARQRRLAARARPAAPRRASSTANRTRSPGPELPEPRVVGPSDDRRDRVAAGRLVVGEEDIGAPPGGSWIAPRTTPWVSSSPEPGRGALPGPGPSRSPTRSLSRPHLPFAGDEGVGAAVPARQRCGSVACRAARRERVAGRATAKRNRFAPSTRAGRRPQHVARPQRASLDAAQPCADKRRCRPEHARDVDPARQRHVGASTRRTRRRRPGTRSWIQPRASGCDPAAAAGPSPGRGRRDPRRPARPSWLRGPRASGPTIVISSAGAPASSPTSRFATARLHGSAAPPTGTPRCVQSGRPASWIVVSRPGSRTSSVTDRHEADPVAGPDQGGLGTAQRPTSRVRAADQPPAAGHLGRVDRRSARRRSRRCPPGRAAAGRRAAAWRSTRAAGRGRRSRARTRGRRRRTRRRRGSRRRPPAAGRGAGRRRRGPGRPSPP